MASEEKLLELLRRAHVVIGEDLIENALDESAEVLHDEIAEVLGLPAVKRETVRCTATWFVAGGRMERQCRENAVNVCGVCGNARCDEHDDLAFEEHNGQLVCEECLPEKRGGAMSTEKGPQASVVAGTCGGQGGGMTTKKWDPTKKTTKWDPRNEFDPITVSPSGSVLWKDYGRPRRYVVTQGNENPREVAMRDREKNEKRERDAAKREREQKRKRRTE